MMKVISLGFGVQSWGLAAMSALGVLPPVDAAVHADTGHERSETYAFSARWTPWLEEHGVQIVTVTAGNTQFYEQPGMNGLGTPPLFTVARDTPVKSGDWIEDESGEEIWHPDGQVYRMDKAGMLRRSCTQRWKIAPMRRWLREQGATAVEQWIGISLDEAERRRLSDVQWVTNSYPFLDFDIGIEQSSRYGISRSDIVYWLQENGLEVPAKSACVFCPYHDRKSWREIQLSGNGDWEKALAVDRAIRHKRAGYVCYLTSARRPLEDCDFRSQEEHGQTAMSFGEEDECTGNCFL